MTDGAAMNLPSPESQAAFESQGADGLSDHEFRVARLWFRAGYDVAMTAEPRNIGWPRVWCEVCGAATPLVTDPLPPGPLNEHAALDLVCGDCGYIIATLHAAADALPPLLLPGEAP